MFDTKTNLLSGNIVKSLLVFAFPMFLSNVFQQLYNTAEKFWKDFIKRF